MFKNAYGRGSYLIEKSYFQSPIGQLEILSDNKWVYGLNISKKKPSISSEHILAKKVHKQLREYFQNKRTKFELPLKFQGTDFQVKVWKALKRIPFGKTQSYSETAKKIKLPKAIRAVGTACGKNPFLILVPCHRVVAQNGDLGGFSAELKNKEFLLSHESFL